MTKGRIEQHKRIDQCTQKVLDRLPDAVTEFYYSMTANKRTSPTKHIYVCHVDNFLRFYSDILKKNCIDLDCEDIKNIRTSTIERYIIYRRGSDGNEISDSTMCVILSALGCFFEFLMSHDYIEKDPFNGKIKKPSCNSSNPVVYLTVDEINTVLNNIKTGNIGGKYKRGNDDWMTRDMLLFLIPIYTGIRVSALSNINVEDINIEENYFTGTDKRDKTRDYHFDDSIKTLILQYLEIRKRKLDGINTDAFFVGNQKQRLSARSISTVVNRYTFNIGKHITPHKLRSTCGTILYVQTGDIYYVSKVLGHENVNTTKRYTDVSEDKIAGAASIFGSILEIV